MLYPHILDPSGLQLYHTIYSCIGTRTVPLTTLVFGLQYGSQLFSYRITAINIWLYAVYSTVHSPITKALYGHLKIKMLKLNIRL